MVSMAINLHCSKLTYIPALNPIVFREPTTPNQACEEYNGPKSELGKYANGLAKAFKKLDDKHLKPWEKLSNAANANANAGHDDYGGENGDGYMDDYMDDYEEGDDDDIDIDDDADGDYAEGGGGQKKKKKLKIKFTVPANRGGGGGGGGGGGDDSGAAGNSNKLSLSLSSLKSKASSRGGKSGGGHGGDGAMTLVDRGGTLPTKSLKVNELPANQSINLAFF